MNEPYRFTLGFLTGATILAIPFIPWIVGIAPVLLVVLLVVAYKDAKEERQQ